MGVRGGCRVGSFCRVGGGLSSCVPPPHPVSPPPKTLRKNVEKRALLENMEGLFLAVDEIVDGG